MGCPAKYKCKLLETLSGSERFQQTHYLCDTKNEWNNCSLYTRYKAEEHSTSSSSTSSCLSANEAEKRENLIAAGKKYLRLVAAMKIAKTKGEFQTLAKQFRGMNGYSDTDKLAKKCENQIKELKQKKACLESERQSLNKQMDAINSEIFAVPQNTDGYLHMVELQKRVQNLISEKKALGFFKFKDKKAVQMQIDSVNAEIALIQLRINSAIEVLKNRILPLQDRIKEIDTDDAFL